VSHISYVAGKIIKFI